MIVALEVSERFLPVGEATTEKLFTAGTAPATVNFLLGTTQQELTEQLMSELALRQQLLFQKPQ